jgi:serine/threonine protein kinase
MVCDTSIRIGLRRRISTHHGTTADGFLDAAGAAAAHIVRDSDRSDLSGRRLGAYEVQASIGAGGMGVVYRALDTKLNRTVAIKFLSADLGDPAARRRFQREAQPGQMLPPIPASGFPSKDAVAALSGARLISEERVFPGPNPTAGAPLGSLVPA